MEVKTYYDAFIVDNELYVINHKDGELQCITDPTRPVEEVSKVWDMIDKHREERDVWLRSKIKDVEKIWIKDNLLPEEEIRSRTKSAWEALKELRKAVFYGTDF